jgi:hypothetical protein
MRREIFLNVYGVRDTNITLSPILVSHRNFAKLIVMIFLEKFKLIAISNI